MKPEEVAGIALHDLLELGRSIPTKVGLKAEDQRDYWEWIAATALTLGYKVVAGREGQAGATQWLSRAFEGFTHLTRQNGYAVAVGVIDRSGPRRTF